MKISEVNFSKYNGLVPVIIQDHISNVVYMLGYMDMEALKRTITVGLVYFYSRSKNRLWMKGEKSGNRLNLKEILVDCDCDTLLIKVELIGSGVCHSGNKTCFYQKLAV